MEEPVILLTSDDLVDPSVVEMWVDVKEDGEVLTGPGKPEWGAEIANPDGCEGAGGEAPVARDGWPSITLDLPAPPPPEPPVSADGRPPGVAEVQSAADLLPQQVDAAWQRLGADQEVSAALMDEWASNMAIAVTFEAATAEWQYARGNAVDVIALAAPGERLDAAQGNGSAFAENWIRSYGCDGEGREIVLAGVVVRVLAADRSCLSPQYLVIFDDQLVVIRDDENRPALHPSTFGALVGAILEQATPP